MPKARHRKETSFQNTVTRSVFLYGKPNTGKRSVLEHMVSAFTELVNRDIRLLDSTPGIFLQLVKNDKEKGYTFLEVEPDYTSQLCPVCSSLDPDNRDGKTFLCTCCGHRDDADHNASVNIRDRASDKEVLDICMEHRYNRKSMQEHLKIVYASRHEKYRTHTASA